MYCSGDSQADTVFLAFPYGRNAGRSRCFSLIGAAWINISRNILGAVRISKIDALIAGKHVSILIVITAVHRKGGSKPEAVGEFFHRRESKTNLLFYSCKGGIIFYLVVQIRMTG